jgi:multidrug efflux pump subunit AcrB
MSRFIFDRARFVIGAALVLATIGLVAAVAMPREEDPRIAPRFGLVVVPYPGADVLAVERHVLEPLEDHLAEVEDLLHIDATARTGVAIFRLTLGDHIGVSNNEEAWDDVEEALSAAAPELPDGALPPRLDGPRLGRDRDYGVRRSAGSRGRRGGCAPTSALGERGLSGALTR